MRITQQKAIPSKWDDTDNFPSMAGLMYRWVMENLGCEVERNEDHLDEKSDFKQSALLRLPGLPVYSLSSASVAHDCPSSTVFGSD